MKKQDSIICCLQKAHFNDKDRDRLKTKGKNIKNAVQFSRTVGFDSLPPCGLQHARLPCPSPTPRAASTNQKKTKVTTLISDKINVKAKNITLDLK